MLEYAVLTEKGKITRSIPELPFTKEQLDLINADDNMHTLFESIQILDGSFVVCQIIPTHVNWDTDTVLHILIQI